MTKTRYFPQSIWSKILRKPKRIINGGFFIEDRLCPAKGCNNILTVVHGDKDIGNCNKCHVNWLHNKTHEDWLRLNEL